MAGFLSGVFDRLGDFADGITGKTDKQNLQAQMAQQAALNEQLIALQKQEIAYRETPEYLAARQKRIYLAAALLVLAVIAALYVLKKYKQ